ncbi:MAG: glycosyltransferase family protein, partial [Solirubrobacteraceae bacterium]
GWLLYGVLRALRRPGAAWKRLRKGNLKPILTAETPAEKAARMPQVVAEYELTEADAVRSEYLRALSKTRFETDKRHVAMAVYTQDLSEGRGDLYVAAGLGRYLERIGYEVVYLPRDAWYQVPEGTQIYLALLDDVDLMQVPADLTRIAWIRNRTDDWRSSPSLPLYDAVLCSSERSIAEVSKFYPGPTGILRIGVDAELFEPGPIEAERTGAVTTVNLWGRERQLFRALRRCRLDFPLGIYGQERGLHEDLMPCWKGPASFFSLPSLYRQAALVLDDHNHTTQPYGNVNSRVYESLASGSLVVTNAALGLQENGLGEIPSYTTPAELDALIHRFLSHPRDAANLARKLQQIVLRDHTFEKRARQFDAFVRDLDTRAKDTERIVIAYYPQSPGNPYEKMLYTAAEKAQVTAIPVDDLAKLLDSRLGNLGNRLVLHVHWTAPILGPGMTAGAARDLGKKFLRQVEDLQKRGAKLVWTVHNVMPHECRFPDEEAAFRQQLADRADLIHVMCARTAEYVSAYYTLPPEKIRVVAHPGYVDVYPNIFDQARARAELGLKPDQTVFCF